MFDIGCKFFFFFLHLYIAEFVSVLFLYNSETHCCLFLYVRPHKGDLLIETSFHITFSG